MKKILFFILVLFCGNVFGQTKQERLIDSILISNTTKTYQEYLSHFEKIDKEHNTLLNTIRKNVKESNQDKNRTLPTVPNKKYTSKEFPMIQIHKGKESKDLRNFSILAFEKIKKVSFLENPRATALYGSQGEFGVYIIEVE